MDVLLETTNITKYFASVTANDNISITIHRGEILALLGENGAGKSTLAEILYGYRQPDSGELLFNGERVILNSPSDAIAQGIGMVHQHFVLVPSLSVIENIVVGTSSTFYLNLKAAAATVQLICASYDIQLDLHAKVGQLSVGEQQWVEILKALYMEARLLILDEPTAVLTPQETERLFTILRQMKADGLSILLITHKLHEIKAVSDRVTILRKGKHVGTVNTVDVSQLDLARLMVGRDMDFQITRADAQINAPLLTIRNLYVQNSREQRVLHDLSLTLHKGEILGLAGVAGNGQRALFEALIGVCRVISGTVKLDGRDITNLSPPERIEHGVASVPQDRLHEGLVLDLGVDENFILGQHRRAAFQQRGFLRRRAMTQRTAEAIDRFDITTPATQTPANHLSGGNLQKLILARELSQQPKCIIASQPTRGLDVSAIAYVHRQLLKQAEEGVGILLISEELNELFALADRIAVIFAGKIMGVFPTSEITMDEVGLLMAGASILSGRRNNA
ncbi:MAG: ABC transporter ATP-binding protein [Chloroflexota bacterium]